MTTLNLITFPKGNLPGLLQLPQAIHTKAWQAAFDAMYNSKDAAAIAEECTGKPAAAKVFKQNRQALPTKKTVCLAGVNAPVMKLFRRYSHGY